MRKTALALLLGCLALSSCYAGPQQLKRTVDNWDQKLYVESPWLDAVLWVVPVIPLAGFGAGIVDFFTNGYTFWFQDAWDGKGTAFEYYKVEPTDGYMQSLLIDGAGFMEVKK